MKKVHLVIYRHRFGQNIKAFNELSDAKAYAKELENSEVFERGRPEERIEIEVIEIE